MKTTLEPITRHTSFDEPARPARVRWMESLLVLLMLIGAVLPMTHRPTAPSRPEVINPDLANEGIRYRDAEMNARANHSRAWPDPVKEDG